MAPEGPTSRPHFLLQMSGTKFVTWVQIYLPTAGPPNPSTAVQRRATEQAIRQESSLPLAELAFLKPYPPPPPSPKPARCFRVVKLSSLSPRNKSHGEKERRVPARPPADLSISRLDRRASQKHRGHVTIHGIPTVSYARGYARLRRRA